MYTKLKTKSLERKALYDVAFSLFAVTAVSIAAHRLELHQALAAWTGFPILGEINPSFLVLIYAMWVLSIFMLRRMEDIYSLIKQRTAFEETSFAKRKNDQLAHLTRGIIHDINNVMTTIRGFGEVAEFQADPDSPMKDNLHNIVSATERATGLLRYLSDFVNTQEIPTELLQVSGIVRGMEPILRYLCRSGKTRFLFELDDESGWTRISRTAMEEIILNLCINSVQAINQKSPEGGDLTVSVDRMSLLEDTEFHGRNVVSGDYIRLRVRDTGPGIPERDLPKIFDLYYTTKNKGCGTGLAVVRQHVESAGGFIRVRSEPGQGATIWVCLPCVDKSNLGTHDLLIT